MRAAPRSVPSLLSRSSPRLFSNVRGTSLLQRSRTLSPKPRCAAFSTSQAIWEKEGQIDQELSAKIESELQMEKDIRDSEQYPASVQEYIDNSPFKLHDTPGQEEVVMTRQFGDETIRLSFSIADLDAVNQDPDQLAEDRALEDEYGEDIPTDTQSGGANTKGAVNQGRTKGGNIAVAPEDRIAPADRPELANDDAPEGGEGSEEPSFAVTVNVTIEKPGKGCIQIDTTAQDGMINIENVHYFKKGELADAQTAELNWSKRNLYAGPPFGNLDEDLQVLLERYLDERGVNTALALFVPDYVDFKEQREYLSWLSNLRSFVDA